MTVRLYDMGGRLNETYYGTRTFGPFSTGFGRFWVKFSKVLSKLLRQINSWHAKKQNVQLIPRKMPVKLEIL